MIGTVNHTEGLVENCTGLWENFSLFESGIERHVSDPNAGAGSLKKLFQNATGIVGNFVGLAKDVYGLAENATELVENLAEHLTDPNEPLQDLSGFFDEIVSRFYGLMCYKMCVKSIDQSLKKADQLIQHWERAHNQTNSRKAEIDADLKKLCRLEHFHEKLDHKESKQVGGLSLSPRICCILRGRMVKREVF